MTQKYKNKYYIILAISIITFIFVFTYYDNNRIVSLAKAEVIGSQWKCTQIIHTSELMVLCDTYVNNTLVCTPRYMPKTEYLNSTNGNGYEEQCEISNNVNVNYLKEYFLILKLFDSKSIKYKIDSKQQAIDMINKKNLIVKLNKNIDIVSIE